MRKFFSLKKFVVLAFAMLAAGCSTTTDVSWIDKDQRHYVPSGLSKSQTMNTARLAMESGLSQEALQKSLRFMTENSRQIPNRKALTIVDYSQHSLNKRMYLLDFENESVETLLTTHGAGSDPDHDGIATEFSNQIGSHKTSLGFYLAQERYEGKYGLSLRLDGLEKTNLTARDRAVVLHSNYYVDEALPYIGRSWGCFVVSPSVIEAVVNRLEGGSLLLAWHPFIESEIVDQPMIAEENKSRDIAALMQGG